MKLIGFLSFTAFIIFFTGCVPQSLLLKKDDLNRMEESVRENADQLEALSNQQGTIVHALEKLLQQQDASILLLDDYSAQIYLQLQEITQKQDEQERRLGKMDKKLHDIYSEEQPDRESEEVRYAFNYQEKQVVGAVEMILIKPHGLMMPARIDTGALTSSLDATDMEKFERNGQEWIRFGVLIPESSKTVIFERPVVRNVNIIQAVTDQVERRPVVELEVTVGNSTQVAQFTLSDRRHMEYSVLIGRNILMDIMVVDVSESKIAPPFVSDESDKADQDMP